LASYLEWLLLPPGGLILLGALGLLLWRRRLGRWAAGTAVLLLWAMSTPKIAFPLIDAVQWYPALDPPAALAADAQAIVILAAGKEIASPDAGHQPSKWTLARLRYGAQLHRQTGLPLVVSGGLANSYSPAIATLMTESLRRDFGVETLAAETLSRNTHENAVYTRQLLAPLGIERIVLVTQSLHMRRAAEAFRRAGFEVIPAPTDYIGPPIGISAYFPRDATFHESSLALHELVGRLWYRLRHGAGLTPAARTGVPSDSKGNPGG